MAKGIRTGVLRDTEVLGKERVKALLGRDARRAVIHVPQVNVVKNDIRSFVDQTVRLMDDRELRSALGTLARQRIEDGLRWEDQSKILIAMYRGLLDHKEIVFSPTCKNSTVKQDVGEPTADRIESPQ